MSKKQKLAPPPPNLPGLHVMPNPYDVSIQYVPLTLFFRLQERS